jgi:hypothetical protein
MIEERWVEVEGFPDYAVSDHGRIKRLTSRTCAKAGSILKTPLRSKSHPYPSIDLCAGGGKRTEMVHILVARAFLEPASFEGAEVNHKNGNKADPTYTNLEWTTSSGNSLHAYAAGLACAAGEANGQAKLTEAQVIQIRAASTGSRGEIACMARTYNVSGRAISDVIARRRWTHI